MTPLNYLIQPNPETMAAMRVAERNRNLEILDLDNFQDFVKLL